MTYLPTCLSPNRVRDAGLLEWKRRIERRRAREVAPATPVLALPHHPRPGALVDIIC